MNLYLRSIGFSRIDGSRGLRQFVNAVSNNPDEQCVLSIDDDNDAVAYIECFKSYGAQFGLMVRGVLEDGQKMKINHCCPYGMSHNGLRCSHLDIEPVNGEYLATFCDDESGNELVFYLQNTLDYLGRKDGLEFALNQNQPEQNEGTVNVAGLCLNGTVVLPVVKDEISRQIRMEEDAYFRELSQKARDGDPTAQTLLDEQEAEISDIIRERLLEEDFLSVVEGFLIPTEEHDTSYSILGDILAVNRLRNDYTKESVFMLELSVTGVNLDVFINESDLVGCPSPGMRFMGSCWLQGRLL